MHDSERNERVQRAVALLASSSTSSSTVWKFLGGKGFEVLRTQVQGTKKEGYEALLASFMG